MSRSNASSGAPWEDLYGYSRAVRANNYIHIAGTTSVDSQGHVVGVGDAYAQTVHVLRTINAALVSFGSGLEAVVRTRIFVTDIASHAEEVGRAHGEFFNNIRPACTLVEVSRLLDPQMLVEVEAEAILCQPERE